MYSTCREFQARRVRESQATGVRSEGKGRQQREADPDWCKVKTASKGRIRNIIIEYVCIIKYACTL